MPSAASAGRTAAVAVGNQAYQFTASNQITDARILIVDDSRLSRQVIRDAVQNYGFSTVAEAHDGKQALELALEFRPDLILTDLIMPVMDGFEFCQRLRRLDGFTDVPILAMTALDKSNDRSAAFSAGATDLIPKPVDRMDLIGRMRVHLDRRRLILRLSEFQKRMDQELAIARSMQESLMPSADAIAHIEAEYPVTIGSHYEASLGLGGDMWGLIPLGKGKLKIYSADFSGHGVGAALNTFRLHAFISNREGQAERPAEWLAQLNSYLCTELSMGQFATMFCAVIDFDSCELRHASAGVPAQLLANDADTGAYRLLDGTGFPLGLIRDATWEESCETFRPGSGLLLFSDALVETPDPPSQVFTPQTLAVFVNSQCLGAGSEKIPACVVDRLNTEAGQKPDDDLTVISLIHGEHGAVTHCTLQELGDQQ